MSRSESHPSFSLRSHRKPSPDISDLEEKALLTLGEIHNKEIELYKENPKSHPDYVKECKIYVATKVQGARVTGDILDVKQVEEEWEAFWNYRLVGLLEESWISKREECLAALRRGKKRADSRDSSSSSSYSSSSSDSHSSYEKKVMQKFLKKRSSGNSRVKSRSESSLRKRRKEGESSVSPLRSTRNFREKSESASPSRKRRKGRESSVSPFRSTRNFQEKSESASPSRKRRKGRESSVSPFRSTRNFREKSRSVSPSRKRRKGRESSLSPFRSIGNCREKKRSASPLRERKRERNSSPPSEHNTGNIQDSFFQNIIRRGQEIENASMKGNKNQHGREEAEAGLDLCVSDIFAEVGDDVFIPPQSERTESRGRREDAVSMPPHCERTESRGRHKDAKVFSKETGSSRTDTGSHSGRRERHDDERCSRKIESSRIDYQEGEPSLLSENEDILMTKMATAVNHLFKDGINETVEREYLHFLPKSKMKKLKEYSLLEIATRQPWDNRLNWIPDPAPATSRDHGIVNSALRPGTERRKEARTENKESKAPLSDSIYTGANWTRDQRRGKSPLGQPASQNSPLRNPPKRRRRLSSRRKAKAPLGGANWPHRKSHPGADSSNQIDSAADLGPPALPSHPAIRPAPRNPPRKRRRYRRNLQRLYERLIGHRKSHPGADSSNQIDSAADLGPPALPSNPHSPLEPGYPSH